MSFNLFDYIFFHHSCNINDHFTNHFVYIYSSSIQLFQVHFYVQRWLAVDEDDGEIDRFLPVASKKNVLSFSNLFSDNTRQKVAEDHLWFSVLFRPQYSNFTRVQRATCCLCLQFLTMIADAMFYGQLGRNAAGTASIQIGPLCFNLGMLWISFISILVVTPPILLVVTLFRMSKPKRHSPNRHVATKSNIAEKNKTIVEVFQPRSPHASCSFDHSKPEGHENENLIEDPKATMDGRRLDPDQRRCAYSCLSLCCKGNHHEDDIMKHAITFDESIGSRRLPHQCVFVSYVLVTVAVAASVFSSFSTVCSGEKPSLKGGSQRCCSYPRSSHSSFWIPRGALGYLGGCIRSLSK